MLKFCGFLCIFLMASQATAKRPHCAVLFNAIKKIQVEGLSQDIVGLDWLNAHKIPSNTGKYLAWKREDPDGTPEGFALWQSAEGGKRYASYVDLYGVNRIHDRTHTFGAAVALVGHPFFKVYSRVDYNYQKWENPKTGKPWTEAEMMKDLKKRGWIDLKAKKKAKYRDLERLPFVPWQLQDSPARSVVSRILRLMPVTMKGSDFSPQTSNHLIEIMKARGIKVDTTRFFDIEYLGKKADRLSDSLPVLEFLYSRLQAGDGSIRHYEVVKFLENQIENLSEKMGEKPKSQKLKK